MKIVTLLGGQGFIGEYLTIRLLGRNDCSIKILDRQNNLSQDFDAATEILVLMTQPNLEIIAQVKNWLKSPTKLKKILYLSTLQVYPDSLKKLKENIRPKPETRYEELKFKEEKYLSQLTNQSGCKLCIARISNVYGNVKNKGIISKLVKSILLEDGDLIINGNPENKVKDFIFVEDAARLLDFLIFYNQKTQKQIFNVCTGQGHSLQQVIKKLEKISSKKIRFRIGETINEKKVNVGNNSKIVKKSGLKIKYKLTEGLKKTYSNYINQFIK